MLFFFVFTLTFGSQWLSWLVPFIILIKPKKWQWFIISITLYLIIVFAKNVYLLPDNIAYAFGISGTIFGFIAWLTTIQNLKMIEYKL